MENYNLQYKGQVSTDWIDSNGHMNVKSYFQLFENAALLAAELVFTQSSTASDSILGSLPRHPFPVAFRDIGRR